MTPSITEYRFAKLALLTVLLLLFVPFLSAQNSGRGFIKGQAGTTLFGMESGLTAGGGFGVRLTEHLDLFAEAGTVQNVMTNKLQEELDALASVFALEFDIPIDLTTKIPCQYGFFGSRITVPIRSVITPFFEIGGGAARLTYDLRAEVAGIDLAPSVREEIGELINAELMLAASAGIHLAATRRFGIDIAYRYFRISTEAPAITGSQVYAGIVYRF